MRNRGAYFNCSVGTRHAGVFAAWCDLREVIPYAFGYMMSAAKVGTGIVAELGAMRISDDRRPRSDGRTAGHLPRRHPPAGAWITLPFHVHRRDRRRLPSPPTSRWSNRSATFRPVATS